MSASTPSPTGQASNDPLLELIITLLTPMFFAVTDGSLDHARIAAAETLASYRAETHQDLITIAKIIAFGLATLASLSRSMDDDLTVNQVLRLRSNANATDRSEHRNRQALDHRRTRQPAEAPRPPEPTPAPPPANPNADTQYAAVWAASAAQVAAETAASLDSLPPDERRGAAIWVGVLNDLAKDLTQNGVPPRPQPGALFRDA